MPIKVESPIKVFDQETFHALDRKLMGIVFEVHNEFGRFLDEDLYKREIASRWVDADLGSSEREVRICVTHESFRKDYSMDLLFNEGLMLETKTAETIAPAHRTQGLHYLFLTGMHHARLVNLRPERVEHEFLSTRLTSKSRQQFSAGDFGWTASGQSEYLREKPLALLEDWGAFLEVALYRDALTHFLGGSERVIRRIPIQSRKRVIGEQSVHLLAPDTAFAVTAVTDDPSAMEEHQLRFSRHTPLRNMQWINFNRNRIEFKTLTK